MINKFSRAKPNCKILTALYQHSNRISKCVCVYTLEISNSIDALAFRSLPHTQKPSILCQFIPRIYMSSCLIPYHEIIQMTTTAQNRFDINQMSLLNTTNVISMSRFFFFLTCGCKLVRLRSDSIQRRHCLIIDT